LPLLLNFFYFLFWFTMVKNNIISDTELVKNDNSQGYISDYLLNSPSKFNKANGYTSSMSIELIRKIIEEDPLVKGVITTLVDKTLEVAYGVTGKDGRSSIPKLKSKLEDLRFNRLIRKVLFNLFLYNNAFVEIVKPKGGEVTDLNVLETQYMKINAEDNGDVYGYYQDVNGSGKDSPSWTVDEVVHFKLDDYSSNVWSPATFQSLKDTILIKDAIRNWMHWFFKTNQLKPIISVEKTNAGMMKDFVEHLKNAENDPGKPIPVMGKVIIEKLQKFSDEGTSIMQVLNWCDRQVLMLLQVPPIAIGLPDSSGRSNSVEQYAALNTRVFAVHRLLEDVLTYDLFPKIGFDKAKFEFSLPLGGKTKELLEMVQIMKNSLFTDEAIEEFLIINGLRFSTGKVLKSEEEIAMMSNKDLGTGNESMKGNSSADASKSRKRQGEGISDANKSEMVKNSKFNSYPYTYEVKE
jgi:hypothetical protein